jgi:hypothetical protein
MNGNNSMSGFVFIGKVLSLGFDLLALATNVVLKTALMHVMMSSLNIDVTWHRRENYGRASLQCSPKERFEDPFAMSRFMESKLYHARLVYASVLCMPRHKEHVDRGLQVLRLLKESG